MKMEKTARTVTFVLVGFMATLAGCGYKTNPLPPQTVVPEAINDLSYVLEAEDAMLSWTYPDEAVNGRDLEEILSFDLYRAEVPISDLCNSCPIPFGAPQELPGGVVLEREPTRGEHVSGMLRSGNKYFFKITSRTGRLAASDDSNIISFVFHTPAAAPANLTGMGKNDDIVLNWRPVTSLADGSKTLLPVRYQVMRSTDGKNFEAVGPILNDTGYVDRDVERGKTYYYRVKSWLVFEGETVDGATSNQVAANVADKVAPTKVLGVTVVASTSNVRIFWNGVDAPDLAGYRIYRRMHDETVAKMIGEVTGTRTIFVDQNIETETGMYYSVSAFDKDGNEGVKSEEATTRY